MRKKLPPVHPGEQLREEFMVPLGLSSNALARAERDTRAHQRDRPREAWHQRRYRASAGALLQHLPPVLVEPAKQLRCAVCRRLGGPDDCTHPAIANGCQACGRRLIGWVELMRPVWRSEVSSSRRNANTAWFICSVLNTFSRTSR